MGFEEGDIIDDFLFRTRQGYCEHFASAFAYLMRAANVPARLVGGYLGGERNPFGNYFIVRQSDAHAWAEVWLGGRGWVRVDPTAVIPADRIENLSDRMRILPDLARDARMPGWATRVWRQAKFGWDNLNHYWNQWIVNYNQAAQKDFMQLLGLGDMDWRGMVGLLMSGIAVVVALFSFRLLRLSVGNRDPVLNAYERFCRKLAQQVEIERLGESGVGDRRR